MLNCPKCNNYTEAQSTAEDLDANAVSEHRANIIKTLRERGQRRATDSQRTDLSRGQATDKC